MSESNYLSGRATPSPNLTKDCPALAEAIRKLEECLDAAVNGTIEGGWDRERATFSVALVSTSQDDPGVPIWEYHHKATKNTAPACKEVVDRHGQYMIGSITKIFVTLIAMKSGINFHAPITDYLPELANGTGNVRWEKITLEMLSCHLGGICRHYGYDEMWSSRDELVEKGFPWLEDSEFPDCGIKKLHGHHKDVTKLLHGLRDRSNTVIQPNRTASYSNVAFVLMELAVERMTGKSFDELLREYITGPCGMEDTGIRPGPADSTKRIITSNCRGWEDDIGLTNASHGIYSSIADMSRLAHGILTRSTSILPNSYDINAWLQPRSFTGCGSAMVGKPWEIQRDDSLTIHPRLLTMFQKSGSTSTFWALLTLIDELGIGIIVLSCGVPLSPEPITTAALTLLVPAIDTEARSQTAKQYAGRFRSPLSGDSYVEAEMALDADDQALSLRSLVRNGKDILAALNEYQNMESHSGGLEVGGPVLIPTGVSRTGTLEDGREVIREEWDLDWSKVIQKTKSQLPGMEKLRPERYLRWRDRSSYAYGIVCFDSFFFVHDAQTKELLGFEAPFLRSPLMTRQ